MSGSERTRRFEALVNEYASDLYRYALWLCRNDALARDLVQETWLRAWKALDRLREQAAAKAWLITILRREFARTFERKVPKFTDLDALEIEETREPGPGEKLERQRLREGILRLPVHYREPLLLQVVMGYSCAEIAAQLGLTESAVMTRLFRAREKLKTLLREDGISGNIHEIF